MRFDWVIFVVFLGYADAQPLPHNHPIVDKCYNLAVDCKHQCMANKGRHKHCVETVCAKKGHECLRRKGVTVT
ncbi:hypothetical protein Q1695_003852 [Nippostrongylus brasiliensis]|nr:hypothetical protein Q1695_003852 [Nippostrongylus brasiliensis]